MVTAIPVAKWNRIPVRREEIEVANLSRPLLFILILYLTPLALIGRTMAKELL
jgi:hypothetical protein